MIGKLTGIFSGYYNNIAIIEVCSNNCCIGYEVLMKPNDLLCLKSDELVVLYIKEIIKEDDNTLYGFLNFEDKCWFEEFIKLSGLGPKGALAILSTYSCEDIVDAILSNNCTLFSSVSGIGDKLANRIPKEMAKSVDKIRERLATFYDKTNNNSAKQVLLNDEDLPIEKKKKGKTTTTIKSNFDERQDNTISINDAIAALIALGFTGQQVYKDVFDIAHQDRTLKSGEIVKKFLQKKEN